MRNRKNSKKMGVLASQASPEYLFTPSKSELEEIQNAGEKWKSFAAVILKMAKGFMFKVWLGFYKV